MPMDQVDELCKHQEDRQEPRESFDLEDEHPLQLPWAEEEEEEGTSTSSSSSSGSRSPPLLLEDYPEGAAASWPLIALRATPRAHPRALAEPLGSQSQENARSLVEVGPGVSQEPARAQASHEDALHEKMADLVWFLLLKYRSKETTNKAEMLIEVLSNDQEHFPVIFSNACECVQLVFGLDVNEADPSSQSYMLATTLGLTYDGLMSPEEIMPKTGLLVIVLGVILLEGYCTSEEHMWEALEAIGICAGSEHFIYGEPRQLLTQVWVQEQYLEYRQVPHTYPARYVFLWGPRAHAETSMMEVLDRFLKIHSLNASCFLAFSEAAMGRGRNEP
ncbi:melanoma-associated antigen 8-like [Talpa occidentalis]|uniref:melanoma-associated antigen 8-like n=1 Tax=Talpa occidentalis TaxID=50954 RepID=UPI0023F7273E|nr:melanoma-associated antigen 8-like [Talpa occidentalis]XP_054551883.1 melanoma-associated antigen 8-like [Talpa occidentalis]XP_054551884.1 melanoma-associated antigen 8-like [Talpa occidentalis]XP_054551885.1 melanoma-associated antigen 8-like [Talpa occidentalis]XP_054551886.1 melanoma-associated antigen 8-like [Talpa occidentalis]